MAGHWHTRLTHKTIDILTRVLSAVFAVGFIFTLWWGMSTISRQEYRYNAELGDIGSKLASTSATLMDLQSQDQYKINDELQIKIAGIERAYSGMSDLFERRSDMYAEGYDLSDIDLEIVGLLASLAELEYENVATKSASLQDSMQALVAASVEVIQNTSSVFSSNDLPGSGYSRQTVSTERGNFTVAMVVAEGASVIVDTAGESDCVDNCPTLALADYVSRNGGFAGINGGYFCPPDYASCQGKVNTFDTLVLNGRTGVAFNQSNNVYSTVPLFAAYGSSLNFYSQTLSWGVDGSSTGALANYPLMLQGNSISFDEGSLPAYLRENKGTRGFIGTRGGAVIIGHVFGASVPDAAYVLQALGIEQALNLDGGGSSALWSGGYKVGPGRSLPVAIILK